MSELYTGDARERPLRITVRELDAAQDRVLHGLRLAEAQAHLHAALGFAAALPYPRLQDEVEQEGQALHDQLEQLLARYEQFRRRFSKRDGRRTLALYEEERTAT